MESAELATYQQTNTHLNIYYMMKEESKKRWKGAGRRIKTVFVVLISLALFIFLIEYYGSKGWYGVLMFAIIWGLYLVMIAWRFLLNGIRYLESQVWGKPLDKRYWGKGEFSRIKTKIVWRKPKHDKEKKT